MIHRILPLTLLFASLPAQSAETLLIDPGHTAVIFNWNHRGLSHPVARLEQVSGKMHLDRSDMTKSWVSVTLPLAGLRTGVGALDRRLRGAEFLDSTAFPAITFKSAKIEASRTNTLKMYGNLSVHGTTKSVALDVTINKIASDRDNKVTAGFDADAVLRRSDFGVGRYVPMTGDELSVHITLEADQE